MTTMTKGPETMYSTPSVIRILMCLREWQKCSVKSDITEAHTYMYRALLKYSNRTVIFNFR